MLSKHQSAQEAFEHDSNLSKLSLKDSMIEEGRIG